jgi:hypothetical protein
MREHQQQFFNGIDRLAQQDSDKTLKFLEHVCTHGVSAVSRKALMIYQPIINSIGQQLKGFYQDMANGTIITLGPNHFPLSMQFYTANQEVIDRYQQEINQLSIAFDMLRTQAMMDITLQHKEEGRHAAQGYLITTPSSETPDHRIYEFSCSRHGTGWSFEGERTKDGLGSIEEALQHIPRDRNILVSGNHQQYPLDETILDIVARKHIIKLKTVP